MEKQIFDKLKKAYGNHTEVAKYIGVTPRAYRNYRNVGKIPKAMQKLLRILAATAPQKSA